MWGVIVVRYMVSASRMCRESGEKFTYSWHSLDFLTFVMRSLPTATWSGVTGAVPLEPISNYHFHSFPVVTAHCSKCNINIILCRFLTVPGIVNNCHLLLSLIWLVLILIWLVAAAGAQILAYTCQELKSREVRSYSVEWSAAPSTLVRKWTKSEKFVF